MADTAPLSELQLAVMNVLWTKGEATAAEVHHALAGRDLAITTISTMLSRLEKRGAVTHRSEGRLFIYRAHVAEREARRSMLASLVDSLFAGDPAEVVSQLLAARDISQGDIARMRALVDEASKARKRHHG